MSYTKGPWEVTHGHRTKTARGVSPVLRFDSLQRTGQDYEANARLIAAAPELLEALQDFVESHDEIWLSNSAWAASQPNGHCQCVKCETARSAIAKALGK